MAFMRGLLLVVLSIVLATAATADEPKKEAKKSPEVIVKEGITQFREGARSSDSKVREKAFDVAMPDKKTMETLFGEDANLIWSRLAESLKQMRERSAQGKEEFDRQGDLVSIELIDVRKDSSGSKRYQLLLEMIPKEIPVYRAVTTTKSGSSGSSSYIVIDGKMKFVRGLESIAEFIAEQKKVAK